MMRLLDLRSLGGPEERFRNYITLAWMLSTGIGIILFLLDVALIAWVRFYHIRYDRQRREERERREKQTK